MAQKLADFVRRGSTSDPIGFENVREFPIGSAANSTKKTFADKINPPWTFSNLADPIRYVADRWTVRRGL